MPGIRSTSGRNKFLTPDRNLILCASHGALFARDNGLCIAGPCPGQSLTPVPIEVLGEYVLLAEGVGPAGAGERAVGCCGANY